MRSKFVTCYVYCDHISKPSPRKWFLLFLANELLMKWSYDPRSCERNFCNCAKKSEKFRTSTGFEPVTSRYQCDALTNWAMKPLTLGNGHLWVLMFPWGMNQRTTARISWLQPRTGIARSRVQTPLKSWIFQASLRNCKNCVHNCEDHSYTWFHIRSSYMIHFIYHFIVEFLMSLKSQQWHTSRDWLPK